MNTSNSRHSDVFVTYISLVSSLAVRNWYMVFMSSFDAVSYGRASLKSAISLVLLANILMKLNTMAWAGHIACDEKCVQDFVRKT